MVEDADAAHSQNDQRTDKENGARLSPSSQHSGGGLKTRLGERLQLEACTTKSWGGCAVPHACLCLCIPSFCFSAQHSLQEVLRQNLVYIVY